MKLFVYGTLRSAAPMHGLLAGEVESLGIARVRARLLDLGAFPGLVTTDADEWVRGELYAIDAAVAESVLERLDRYEGDSFEREEDTVVDAEGNEVRALLYRYRGDPAEGVPVTCGDWLEYSAGRSVPLGS